MTRQTVRRCASLLASVFVFSTLAVSPTDAQIVKGRPSLLHQQFTHLAWTLKGDTTDVTVSQWYLPILVSASVAPTWEVSFLSALSGSDANWSLADDQFSGLSDSRVQVAHAMANDRVLVSAGMSLPTGKTELTPDNRALLPWLTADFFNFPLKYPGEGFNLFGEVGTAMPAGNWTVGVGAAVHYAGEYTPFDDGRKYQPGSRILLTGSAAQDFVGRGHVALNISAIFSGNDKASGEPVFADGTVFDIRLSGQRKTDRGQVDASVRAILRGKNKLLDPQSLDVVLEQNNTNGSDVRLSLRGRHALRNRLDGWLSLEARFLAANGYAPGDPLYEDAASITGLGGGLDLQLSPRATAGLGIRIWRGTSDGAASYEPLDLSGVEIIQRLSFTI